jgi:hypothetical protein
MAIVGTNTVQYYTEDILPALLITTFSKGNLRTNFVKTLILEKEIFSFILISFSIFNRDEKSAECKWQDYFCNYFLRRGQQILMCAFSVPPDIKTVY